MRIRAAKVALLLPLLLGIGTPLRAWAGCEKDTDCKGDRICENGVCGQPSSQPPAAPPPQPPQPPPYLPPQPYYGAPPMYAMPPPPPLPPRWAIPPLHGARSYLALGGVGDFLNPDFGGVSVEGQATFRFFNVSGVDGALTVNILDDLSFAEVSAGYPAFESIAGGIGFDFGFFKALQLGPRLDFGYGSDVTGTIPLYGAFVSFGGHLIGWVNRFIGIYADVDGLFALETFAPNGVRFAAGLAFSVD